MDRLGNEWDAELRAKMRQLSFDLAELHASIPLEAGRDAVFATWFGGTLLVMARGASAAHIAEFVEYEEIAAPETARRDDRG